ncbi:MAG: GNAT family N-acetyltransferase [Ruthenibacterium sp.]
MLTEMDKYEIHCGKRYLDYTEDAHFRALRDPANPESYESNYAVLKDLEEAETSLARIELFFTGTNAQTKLWSRPDSAPLDELRPFLTAHGYRIKEYQTMRMLLTDKPSPLLLRHKCAIKCLTGERTQAEQTLLQMCCNDHVYEIKMMERQIAAGARIFMAYSMDGTPVSCVLGESFGSAFYFSDVFTAGSYRNRGFAAEVIFEAIRYAKDVGYTDLFLDCTESGPMHLYEKIGFRGETVNRFWAFRDTLPTSISQL